MVTETIIYVCCQCGSSNIVKNGRNGSGSQQFWCKDCGKRGVLKPRRGYTEEQKEQILTAYYERPNMRGIERIFGSAVTRWRTGLKKRPLKPIHKRNAIACAA